LPSSWSNTILLVADNPDEGGDFPTTSDRVATNIPPGKTIKKIYLSNTDITTARSELLSGLKNGALIFNYFGHGAWNRLAAEGVLKSTDIPSLTNEYAMAITLGMGCFVNNFVNYAGEYIGETMVLQKTGGMIASWSPSGNSLNNLASKLDSRFLYHYFQGSEVLLGDIVNASIEDYVSSGDDLFESNQLILLGDPALKLR